jgi:hypothetical protein
MCAAEKLASDLYPVPDHFTLAMLADGRHRLNRALEAVENMLRTCGFDYKGLIVLIATNFAVCHKNLLSLNTSRAVINRMLFLRCKLREAGGIRRCGE